MDDILSAQQASRRSPKSDDAAEWLRAMLTDGAVAASVVQEQAKAAGHGKRAEKRQDGPKGQIVCRGVWKRMRLVLAATGGRTVGRYAPPCSPVPICPNLSNSGKTTEPPTSREKDRERQIWTE